MSGAAMFSAEIRVATDRRDMLGEGVVWDAEGGRLFWVDIEGRAVHCLIPGDPSPQTWILPERIGSLGLLPGGQLLAALESGFALVSLSPFALTRLASPAFGHPRCRFNDGRADRQGRFWAGVMDDQIAAPLGGLWRRDADGSLHRMLGDVTIANSLAFSPDGATLYFADSPQRVIWAFPLDRATGALGPRRVFAETEPGAFPDGATVDAEGRLWSAQWGAGRVRIYAPDGAVLGDLALPVPQVSCCAFGGPALDTLYVTSARHGMDAGALADAPLSGALFAVTFSGAARPLGLPEPRLQTKK